MYPEVAPDVRIEETISHPIRQEEVIGFLGRNTMLGRTAVLMKEDAITENLLGDVVMVPTSKAELLSENGAEAELLVLKDDSVLAMDGSDFHQERNSTEREERGQRKTVPDVFLDSDKFRSFDRSRVLIEN